MNLSNTIPISLDLTDKEKYETDKLASINSIFMAKYIWALPPRGIAEWSKN